MTLAEKGLPHSGSVGNELYDKLGSLGLTSFMQEVTRVRALEGELARTIQMMHGVKAARVHVVLADAGSFRRERQPPSASVIVRTDGGDDHMVGEAICHLVASAIPDMKPERSDGPQRRRPPARASGSDSMEKSPDNLLGLEKERDAAIFANRSTTTLAPYLEPAAIFRSASRRASTPTRRRPTRPSTIPTSASSASVRVTKEQPELTERGRHPADRRQRQLAQDEQTSRPRPSSRPTRPTSAKS